MRFYAFGSIFSSSKEHAWSTDPYPQSVLNINSVSPRYLNLKFTPHILCIYIYMQNNFILTRCSKTKIIFLLILGQLFTCFFVFSVVSLQRPLQAISYILHVLYHYAQSPTVENETVNIFRIQRIQLSMYAQYKKLNFAYLLNTENDANSRADSNSAQSSVQRMKLCLFAEYEE